MKTMKYISGKYILLFIVLSIFSVKGRAQSIVDNLRITIDWQMNAPVSTDFANKISGWGMNFEGNYEVAPHWDLGAFLNYHTNHNYVGRQTITDGTVSLTTDRQESAFQLPFGLTSVYRFTDDYGCLRPYVGAKVGAMYAKNTTYLNTVSVTDKPWGFYVSPELGMNIYPVPDRRFAFHVAVYYSYATNKSEVLTGTLDGENNVGFRVGVSF